MTLDSESGTFKCFTSQVNHLELETIPSFGGVRKDNAPLVAQSILSITASLESERHSKGLIPLSVTSLTTWAFLRRSFH